LPHITLLGLPGDLASELTRGLIEESHQVSRQPFISDLGPGPQPAVVFISADCAKVRASILQLRAAHLDLPVVVITCLYEPGLWIDALEAGASDYCSAPFEPAPALDSRLGKRCEAEGPTAAQRDMVNWSNPIGTSTSSACFKVNSP
jgi:FixJ family two-component response regulator